MNLEFWGAAQSTTGSLHVLNLDGRKIMLDCGLFQGRREEARRRNLEFPISPTDFDSVVLSHAHIDHSGNLPNLVKQGYAGPIHTVAATADLCQAMLRDSAHIQERDAEYVNKKNSKNNKSPVEPLYTMDDAERVFDLIEGKSYDQPFEVTPGLKCTFIDAGHILGSAISILEASENSTHRRIVFSGDLGRRNLPILRDPEVPDWADILILESTYGNRTHEDFAGSEDRVAAVIQKAVERRGKIIVPAFSVGRTQEFVYCLHRLFDAGRLPRIPIYVDSPLSVDATEVFRRHPECYDEETRAMLANSHDAFGFSGLHYIRTTDESKALNRQGGPCIIISASGMCEAGRILHHLKNNIDDPKNCVLVIGYMAENTLGRKLVERQPEVRIFGETHRLRAEVKILNSFSAHADVDDLADFARRVAANGKLRKIFVVHGEPVQSTPLVERLRKELPGIEVHYPERGSKYEI